MEDDQQDHQSLDEVSEVKESPLVAQDSQEEGEDGVADGTNKFYCYLCSITCHNQQVSSIKHTVVVERVQPLFYSSTLLFFLPRTSGVI